MSHFFYELPSNEHLSDPLKVSEEPSGGYGKVEDFSEAGLMRALGTAEWFLVYTHHNGGTIEGFAENSTYSFSIESNGNARVTDYVLTKNHVTGKFLTAEDSISGDWEISGGMFRIKLPDETLEYIVTSVEYGVAQMIDPDYNAVSVFMTEAAFKVATRQILDL